RSDPPCGVVADPGEQGCSGFGWLVAGVQPWWQKLPLLDGSDRWAYEQRVPEASCAPVLEGGNEDPLVAQPGGEALQSVGAAPGFVDLDQRDGVGCDRADQVCDGLLVVLAIGVPPHVDVPVEQPHAVSRTPHLLARARRPRVRLRRSRPRRSAT